MTGIATVEQKREILQKLRSEKKYRKPWESGDLAAISFLGGDGTTTPKLCSAWPPWTRC
jgi:hypothetical protein